MHMHRYWTSQRKSGQWREIRAGRATWHSCEDAHFVSPDLAGPGLAICLIFFGVTLIRHNQVILIENVVRNHRVRHGNALHRPWLRKLQVRTCAPVKRTCCACKISTCRHWYMRLVSPEVTLCETNTRVIGHLMHHLIFVLVRLVDFRRGGKDGTTSHMHRKYAPACWHHHHRQMHQISGLVCASPSGSAAPGAWPSWSRDQWQQSCLPPAQKKNLRMSFMLLHSQNPMSSRDRKDTSYPQSCGHCWNFGFASPAIGREYDPSGHIQIFSSNVL